MVDFNFTGEVCISLECLFLPGLLSPIGHFNPSGNLLKMLSWIRLDGS
jgi:hypothetical protein